LKKIQKYKDKKILVLGLAKSGYAAAKLLHRLGAIVLVNDKNPYEGNEEAHALHKLGIEVICGEHPLSVIDESIDAIIKNPGIPYSNPIIVKALGLEIPVLTEIELAYEISEAPFIGITGSNGKTTTTTLIFNMLDIAGKQPLIAGNIGTVACEVAQNATKDNLIVTELSSFQLMGVDEFHPKISVFLNLFEAHLDYHGTKRNYGLAKGNILAKQSEDEFAIINADDKEVCELASISKAQKIYFSTKKYIENGACLLDGYLCFKGEKILSTQEVALPGQHNIENILAAICAVKLLGVENESIREILTNFNGVKHRLQYVSTVNERAFYNDSKATNILATSKALSSFSQPIILLAGGLDRGNSFDELKPFLSNVKALVTFGETAEKLKETAQVTGIKTIKHVDNVEQAVPVAYGLSSPGDVILLSPACASWDQYRTFEVRGDIFVEAVHKLK
jgi:UDP-N-acetylmuramoylalanine--D-glutamate ligase